LFPLAQSISGGGGGGGGISHSYLFGGLLIFSHLLAILGGGWVVTRCRGAWGAFFSGVLVTYPLCVGLSSGLAHLVKKVSPSFDAGMYGPEFGAFLLSLLFGGPVCGLALGIGSSVYVNERANKDFWQSPRWGKPLPERSGYVRDREEEERDGLRPDQPTSSRFRRRDDD
jgi:hypothetical protein